MAQGDIQGRAYASPSAPRSKAVCDRCGEWNLLSRLNKQQEFYGTSLAWTGYLVCDRCLDEPQPQLKPLILPPDPVPVMNPRPEAFRADYRLSPFTQYLLFQPIYADQSTPDILAALALASKVPTPGGYTDYSATIFPPNVSLPIIPPDPNRTWLAIYNPSSPQLQISLGTAVWGNPSNIILGPGEAVLASGVGNVPLGQITFIGLLPNIAFNAYAAD